MTVLYFPGKYFILFTWIQQMKEVPIVLLPILVLVQAVPALALLSNCKEVNSPELFFSIAPVKWELGNYHTTLSLVPPCISFGNIMGLQPLSIEDCCQHFSLVLYSGLIRKERKQQNTRKSPWRNPTSFQVKYNFFSPRKFQVTPINSTYSKTS